MKLVLVVNIIFKLFSVSFPQALRVLEYFDEKMFSFCSKNGWGVVVYINIWYTSWLDEKEELCERNTRLV